MSENTIVSGPNFFQRTLVPEDSSLTRGAMRKAAEWGTSDNILARHVVSTAFAVASVALSILNTISYLLQLPVKIVLNIVRFDPKGLVFDFAQSLSDTARSLLMGAFGATYVIGGILFPEEVYGFFKPAAIKTAEDALSKKQKELEDVLVDNKDLQERADQFLRDAKQIEIKLRAAERELQSATTPEGVQLLKQKLAEVQQELEAVPGQLRQLQEEHEEVTQKLSNQLKEEKGFELLLKEQQYLSAIQQLEEKHQQKAKEFEEQLKEKEQQLQQKIIGSAQDKQPLEKLQEQHKLELEGVKQEHKQAIDLVQQQARQLDEQLKKQGGELRQGQTANLKLQEEVRCLRVSNSEFEKNVQRVQDEFQQSNEEALKELKNLEQLLREEKLKPNENGLRRELEQSQREVLELQGRVKQLEDEKVKNSAALLSQARPAFIPNNAPPVNDNLAHSLVTSLPDLVVVDPIARAEVFVAPKARPESPIITFDEEDFVEIQPDERSDVEKMRSQIGFTGQANLMTYLYHFFNAESKAPEDTQPISFNLETGRIELKVDEKARANFCQILRETYGGTAATRAITLYKLNQPGPLTYLDVKKAIVAVAANVKVKDLADLFDDLKNETPSRLIALLIPEGERQTILQFERFDQIPPHHEALHLLLKAYRTLAKPGAEAMERIPVFNYFAIEGAPSQGFRGFQQYYHDLKTLFDAILPAAVEEKGVKTVVPSSVNIRKMCTSEHFAKSWGYREIRPGNIATQFGGTLFELVDEIEHKADAVFFRFYAPMNAAAGKYDEEHPLTCHLVTRGTQWKLSAQDSGVSFARDVELSGVGKGSFVLRAEAMEKIITKYLENVPEGVPVHLSLDGHSLGACDEMRVATLIAKLLAERPDLSKKVSKIHVNPQNPPALDPATNEEFAKALKTLEERHPEKKELFELTYSLFDQDKVQWIAPGVYLGARIDSPLLKCRAILLKPPTDYKGAIHVAKPFTEDADRVFEATVVDEKSKLAPILERESYRNPENGMVTNTVLAITGAITSLTFNGGQALLVNPVVRLGTGFGGMFTGRATNDNIYESAIFQDD